MFIIEPINSELVHSLAIANIKLKENLLYVPGTYTFLEVSQAQYNCWYLYGVNAFDSVLTHNLEVPINLSIHQSNRYKHWIANYPWAYQLKPCKGEPVYRCGILRLDPLHYQWRFFISIQPVWTWHRAINELEIGMGYSQKNPILIPD